jgi:hypothetical protein
VKQIEISTHNDATRTEQLKPYFEARRKLESRERLQELFSMKIMSDQSDSETPAAMLVEIIDKPEAQLRPVYPNRPLAAALTLLGVLLSLTGALLFKSGPPAPHVLQPA